MTLSAARTLLELDARIHVWTGLPAAISNWFTRSPSETRSRLRHPFRSIYFGIPIYLLAGTVLQLSASGVLGTSHISSLSASPIAYLFQVLVSTDIAPYPPRSTLLQVIPATTDSTKRTLP